MYKMLIVDDNPLEREGILNIINWPTMEIEIVGACQNGKMGLKAAEELKPDIILTDIFMPVMDGIEMVKQIRKKNAEVKIIFMSCHGDFEYARTAIHLDIEYYIMKPVFEEELKAALLKVLNKQKIEMTINRERQDLLRTIEESYPILREQFFRQLLFGLYQDKEQVIRRLDFLKCNHLQGKHLCVSSLIASPQEEFYHEEDIQETYIRSVSIKKIIESYSNNNIYIYLVQISATEYAIILAVSPTDAERSEAILLDLFVDIKNEIFEKLSLNMMIGVSNISSNLAEISYLYKQSVFAAKTKYYSLSAEIIFYKDIESMDDTFEEKVDLQVLHKEVKELLTDLTINHISVFIDKYIGEEGSCPIYTETYIKSFAFSVISTIQLVLFEMNESFKSIVNDEMVIWKKLSAFETIKDVRQWLYNILDMLRQYFFCNNNTQHIKIVEKIKEILHQRYAEQLTIKEIANLIYISSGHANNIFRKIENKTIFDYLIEYRVEAAKKLLRDPSKRIYEVAEEVGYNNKSHFCLIFRNYTGISPSEYRSKYSV